MTEWRPIETVPTAKRVRLYRGAAEYGTWAEEVVAEFHDGLWRWPDPLDNSSLYGPWTEDELLNGYAYDKFTHWMPLPGRPPKAP